MNHLVFKSKTTEHTNFEFIFLSLSEVSQKQYFFSETLFATLGKALSFSERLFLQFLSFKMVSCHFGEANSSLGTLWKVFQKM